MSITNHDPNRIGDEPGIDWEELPWAPQDHAFDLISTTFSLSEDMIEALPMSEKVYWAALTEAAASCIVDNGPNGEVTTLSPTELIELHTAANTSEIATATTFLHEFTFYSLRYRSDLAVTGFSPTSVSAGHYLARALATFAPAST